MSVNEEFLDEVLGSIEAEATYSDSNAWVTESSIQEAKEAILQHFQQEQETTLRQGFYAGQANAGIKLEEAHKNWKEWSGYMLKTEVLSELGEVK